jgi:hypothetical protein
MNTGMRATWVSLLTAVIAGAVFGCGCATVSTREDAGMTEKAEQALRDTEILLPILPDSIVAIYSRYDHQDFHTRYGSRVNGINLLMDFLSKSSEGSSSQ